MTTIGGFGLPVFFDTDEIDDRQTRQAVERAIGECLGDRLEEHWRIQIESRSEYYRVSVKGPGLIAVNRDGVVGVSWYEVHQND